MSKLKAHQVFFIEMKVDEMTPQQLADELEVPVAGVRAVIRKIKKARLALPPVAASPAPGLPDLVEAVAAEAPPEKARPDAQPEKPKLPPGLPGVRPSTVFMTEGDSARYDSAAQASRALASPRLKRCVSVVDPDAPVY